MTPELRALLVVLAAVDVSRMTEADCRDTLRAAASNARRLLRIEDGPRMPSKPRKGGGTS